MRPLFPFYGSKWRDAKRYGQPTSHVVEPFAGSAGYSTYWEPERVTLIDADPILVGVWSYLIAASAEDILALPDVEPGQDVRDMDLSQEAAWLIGFWLNRGSATPKRRQTAFSARTERGQLVWGQRARERIAADIHLVDHWSITLGDFESAPRDEGATYFIDPPYVEKGKYYRIRLDKPDYPRLAACARALPGRRVVCENADADWLPFQPLASIKSTKGVSHEVVWEAGAGSLAEAPQLTVGSRPWRSR